MEEIILALLGAPAFRALVTEIALAVMVDIFHRRSVNPEFMAKSDQAFGAFMNAKTDGDKKNALAQIQALMASSGS